MRNAHRVVFAVMGFALIIVLSFPSWDYTYSQAGMQTVRNPAGHSWLWNPPARRGDIRYSGVRLAIDRLVIEVGIVLAVGMITAFAVPWNIRSDSQSRGKESDQERQLGWGTGPTSRAAADICRPKCGQDAKTAEIAKRMARSVECSGDPTAEQIAELMGRS